jgi:hypothetical protein
MLPNTSERVPLRTRVDLNRRIQRQTEASLMYFAAHPEEIAARLQELEREWDIERSLEVNGSAIALTGIVMSLLGGRKWLVVPTAVVGFCMQHALSGWCPPLTIFRRMGVRTQREIDEERFALKALRGDFAALPARERLVTKEGASELLDVVR